MSKFLFFFLCCTALSAQNIDLGLKAGLNRSSVIGDFREGYQGRLSFHAGAFLEVPMGGKFSFHPEVLYSSQGFTFDVGDFNFENPGERIIESEDKGTAARNFLVIPLITRFSFSNNFSFELGPQLGFLINEVTRIDGVKYSYSGDLAFDIGPAMGLGFDLGDKLKLQLRYFIGLSDLLRKSPFEERGFSDNQFDTVIQLSVGHVIF